MPTRELSLCCEMEDIEWERENEEGASNDEFDKEVNKFLLVTMTS